MAKKADVKCLKRDIWSGVESRTAFQHIHVKHDDEKQKTNDIKVSVKKKLKIVRLCSKVLFMTSVQNKEKVFI